MIDVDELLERARSRSGLSDFGDDAFMDPLERLVDSLNSEARLSEFGQQSIPKILTSHLSMRLQVEHWYACHPEIDDQQIVAPVFGIGLPRTGSTALGHMLAQDRNTRSLRGWEAWHPCPPPETATEDSDPRIAAAEARTVLDKAVPQLKNMVPRDPRGPEECVALLSLTFLPHTHFEIWAHVPSYSEWVMSQDFDWRPAYRYHQRVIKLLQWRCPPRRWFLKTPMHTFALDALEEVYPDAKFVWTHRDPAKALPSMCSLMYNFRLAYSDNPDPTILGKAQERDWRIALERALAFRDRIGEKRFFDLSHRRQAADPVEQLRPLYDKLGWDFQDALEAKIRQWQDTNPKGEHRFSPDFFGQDPDELTGRYRFYSHRFAALM
jgi:Sulfotransferase family